MASNRFTIASNANQSIRAPLVVPTAASVDPRDPNSIRSVVLKAASSKLRIKKGSRIFLARDGQEIVSESDWTNIPVDCTLLVSSGEEYVGIHRNENPNSFAGHPDTSPRCPVRVISGISSIDSQAVGQLEVTARSLPGIVYAVGQPDLHPGNKFPIGAVYVSRDWIHPPLIGSDIGCGMSWYRTNLTRKKLEGEKATRLSKQLTGLDDPWRTEREQRLWLTQKSEGDILSNDPTPSQTLGTIGAGNHFAELQVVERGNDVLQDNEIILLVHSGSRNLGGSILDRFTAPGPTSSDQNVASPKTSLLASSPEGKAYLAEHDRACVWASLNRDLIALRFLTLLEPSNPSWEAERVSMEDTARLGDETVCNAVSGLKAAIVERRFVNVTHNAVERIDGWSLRHSTNGDDTAEEQKGGEFFVHRKGAAPSNLSTDSGANVVLPLPGSRGTPTLILAVKNDEGNQYGRANALSVAHGAGRAMSRAKALNWVHKLYKGKPADCLEADRKPRSSFGRRRDEDTAAEGSDFVGGLAERMGDLGINESGKTVVVCDNTTLVWEEAPEAYKDVWAVGEDLERAGAAKVVGWTRARINYKVSHKSR